MRCPKCLSSNVTPFKVVLWKCLDCNAVFSTPEHDAIVAATDGMNDGAKYLQSAADAVDDVGE